MEYSSESHEISFKTEANGDFSKGEISIGFKIV